MSETSDNGDDKGADKSAAVKKSNAEGKGNADSAKPGLLINAQYLKDLSFENPNAPAALAAAAKNPNITVDINTEVKLLAEQDGQKIFEVILKLIARSEAEGAQLIFLVECVYGAMVTLKGDLDPKSEEAVLYIEVARLLYPYIRGIVGQTVADGGFPAMLLQPVDFTALLLKKRAAAAANKKKLEGEAEGTA